MKCLGIQGSVSPPSIKLGYFPKISVPKHVPNHISALKWQFVYLDIFTSITVAQSSERLKKSMLILFDYASVCRQKNPSEVFDTIWDEQRYPQDAAL